MASTSWPASLKLPRSAFRRATATEVRELCRFLREPGLWLLMLVMAFCGSLAYSASYAFDLDIGGSPKDCFATAVFDAPYLHGFNIEGAGGGVEFDAPPERCAAATVAYRWAFEDAAVRLPGVGRGVYVMLLRVTTGQPSGMPVLSGWHVNGRPTLALPLNPAARTYHLVAPPSTVGNLALQFVTPTYQPAGDPRSLAFAADRLRVEAVSRVSPDWTQLAVLSGIVGLSYLLARRWLLPQITAGLVALALVAVLVALLLWQRQGLTSFSVQALRLVVVAYGLSLGLEPLARGLARHLGLGADGPEARLVVALVALAWLIRTLGLFHPQTYSSDVGLNINNLIGVTRGEIIFTEGLPSDAGGGDAPYPPAQYVMLAPLQLLGLEDWTLVTAANALIDSLAIMWLWLIMRSVGAPRAAAIGAGTLYLFAPPLLRSLSTGEMANVWGQALVLPWLLLLLRWRQRKAGPALLGLATAVALLGHSGVFLSMVLVLGTVGLVLLLRRDKQVRQFALVSGVTLVAVVAGYYSAFSAVLRERSAAPPPTTTALERLGFEWGELVWLTGQIGPVLALLGLAGLVLAWRVYPRLAEILVAWWMATLLSWGTLLVSQQALRWEAFVLPAVALGGGLVLGEAWQRRTSFRPLALAIVMIVLVHGGALWVQRLVSYR
ncbi:MAG: hypothetical protein CYG59_26025 [Chloroflexi bacterium]|nr:MAG: hypothetical protein CYG59_26025 [Chloroflexota bacterium]